MNILYTNFHNSPTINGHVTYLTTLIKNLKEKHAIYVATPIGSALYEAASKINGVRLYGVAFPSGIHRISTCAGKLKRIIKKEHIDIIHVNGSSDHKAAMIATMLMKKKPKIIFTKHNDMPVKLLGSLLRSRFATDAVIAVCSHVENLLKKSTYKNAAISKIYNGIDTNYFSPASEIEKREIRLRIYGDSLDYKFVIGSNAGTSDYKNWMDMVRAVAKLNPMRKNLFHVAVAGGPISVEDLREIENLGMLDNFTYAGMLEDVRCFIKSIDMGYVLSSRVETISFACREMMSCGKPTIVTAYSGLPENITDGSDGWVVPVHSPDVITRILTEIADQSFDLIRMGNNARIKASEHFGVDCFINQTERIYMTAIETSSSNKGKKITRKASF